MLLISILGCSESYKPDLCTVVNISKAQCSPTDPRKPQYDLEGADLLGYTCLSPKDFSEGKKRIRAILEGLE
jgi:hypothetical protein